MARPLNSGLNRCDLEVCLDVNRALKQDVRYNTPHRQSPDLNDEGKATPSPPPLYSVPLTTLTSPREGGGKGSEQLLIKTIEVQHVGDRLNMCYTGSATTPEKLFQSSLIPTSLDTNLLENTQLQGPEESSAGYEERGVEGSHTLFTPAHIKMLFADSKSHSETDGNSMTNFLIGRDVGQSQQTATGLLDKEEETGDEAVECDLMRHSSTLIVLEKQRGFIGLLIPHSDEITNVSFLSEHQQLDYDYSSTLRSHRPKIAAFYIPENNEVVDIDSTTKMGFIDHHTAEVLKSIEFPAALPDVEQLNAKFSSWLMFRELTLDGCNHATSDLEFSSGHPNTPSPSEMRLLFTSYLMMNSYLDPNSGQRLLVLDRRLTNMVQLFIEDLAFCESHEPTCSSLTSDVYDISGQVDFEMHREDCTDPQALLHIDEEDTHYLSRNKLALNSNTFVTLESDISFDEAQFNHVEVAEYNTEYISFEKDMDYTHSAEFDMSFDETKLTHVEVAEYNADDNTVCISTEYISFEKNMNNTHSTEFENDVNIQYYLDTEHKRATYEDFDIPMHSETSNFPTSCSGNSPTSHSSSIAIESSSKSYSVAVKSSDETQSAFNTNSLCIGSGHTTDISTEPSCFQQVREYTKTMMRDNATALEQAQIEKRDILYTTSVDHHSPTPLFNEQASGSLVLQLCGEEYRADEKGTMSVFNQSVPRGSVSSLHINDPPSLLGGGSDVNSVAISANLALKDVGERVTVVVPHLDLTPRAIINPEASGSDFTCNQRIPGLVSMRSGESSLQNYTENKVVVMMLDVPDEQIDRESGNGCAEWRSIENVREINNHPHPVLPSCISHGPSGTQMISASPVTEASAFPHAEALSLRADLGRQEMIYSQLTHTINQSENAFHNHAQPTLSLLPGQINRAFDRNIESPLGLEYTTPANLCCAGDGSPIDRDFLRDECFYGLLGHQTVSPVQSDSGMSSSLSDVLSEESKAENVSVSLTHSSLISEHSQAMNDSSPRDVFGNAVSTCSASRGDDKSEIIGVSHEIVYPQQPLFCSEGNLTVEMKPASSVSQAGIGDTECIQSGPNCNSRLESDCSAADIVELGRDTGRAISLEKQPGQSLTMTNDGMQVCLSTDPETRETHANGLNDSRIQIDGCINKTLRSDINLCLLNDKQTGLETDISPDVNKCDDSALAENLTSFSGRLLDLPMSDTARLSNVMKHIHGEHEEVHIDPLQKLSTQLVEGGIEDLNVAALQKTQHDGRCTEQVSADKAAVKEVNKDGEKVRVDPLQKPNTQRKGAAIEGVTVNVLQETNTQCEGADIEGVTVAVLQETNTQCEGADVEGVTVDVLQETTTQQDERGAEQVGVDALEKYNTEHEGSGVNGVNSDRCIEGVNANTLQGPSTNHEKMCTEQMNKDEGAVINVDALQKPYTQHDEEDTDRFNVDEGVMEEVGRDAECIEKVNVYLSQKPNEQHEGAGVQGFNVDVLQRTNTHVEGGAEGVYVDALQKPNTQSGEGGTEHVNIAFRAIEELDMDALQKPNPQHEEGDTDRFDVDEGVMEEVGRDAECIEKVNVYLSQKPNEQHEGAGVQGFNVDVLQRTNTHVEGGAEGVYVDALQKPNTQSGEGGTEHVNIADRAIEELDMDALQKPNPQHEEGGTDRVNVAGRDMQEMGLDEKCIKEVSVDALHKPNTQHEEAVIDRVNVDVSQETDTRDDDEGTEQFKIDALQKPHTHREEGDVKGVNSDEESIEAQKFNVEVLEKHKTKHEERGLDAEFIEAVKVGNVNVLQETSSPHDEGATVGVNIDALQKSSTQLGEGRVKGVNSDEGGFEKVNVDASQKPNTQKEEWGTEEFMANTKHAQGGTEEFMVDALQEATTEEGEGGVTEDEDMMTWWSDRSVLDTKDTGFGSLQSSGPDHLVKWRDQNDLSANGHELGPLDSVPEEEFCEMTQPLDVGILQSKLLQVLQNVPDSQDPSVLQGVIESLGIGLESDSQGDRWHTLESIKEESSEEDEEKNDPATEDVPGLHLSTELCHPPFAQTSSNVTRDGDDKQNNRVIHLCCFLYS